MAQGLTIVARFKLAWRMLSYQKGRLIGTTLGVAVGFFLAASQFGLLVGWINTTTALIRHARADLWVMAGQTPAYDYGTAIPRQTLYQLRSVPGIERTEALFVAWNIWQRGDGRRTNIEMIGLDNSGAGGPWRMLEGTVDCVQRDDTVIVDELYLEDLGISAVGDEFEILGRRAGSAASPRECAPSLPHRSCSPRCPTPSTTTGVSARMKSPMRSVGAPQVPILKLWLLPPVRQCREWKFSRRASSPLAAPNTGCWRLGSD